MVTRISSVHRLEFFPRGYSSKLKKKNPHVSPTGEIYSFTHLLYYHRQASFRKLITLLPETEAHERVKYQCKEA